VNEKRVNVFLVEKFHCTLCNICFDGPLLRRLVPKTANLKLCSAVNICVFFTNVIMCSGFGAGFNHPITPGPFYTNWGLQTCCQSSTVGQHVATAHHPVDPRFEPNLETCVDDEISCEIVESASSEEMVSSWTGISGVPGLGYSIRPKEGCELETCELSVNTAQQVQDILNSEPEWSANSAQNLASLKVDLPRVNHHDLIRSRTVSVHNPLQQQQNQSRETSASKVQPQKQPPQKGGSGGYHGVSAVGHLMSDSVNFERHNPQATSKNAKRPLRATVSSRLKSKLSLPASWPSSENTSGNTVSDQKQPNSLPSQFIPRAPIPTPEVLAAARNNKASKNQSQSQRSSVTSGTGSGQNSISPPLLSSPRPQKSQQDSFSANNDAILKQDQMYQSPRERDGDYSYAYDCSISPAVVIKWNEENESENDSDFGTESDDQDSNPGSPGSDVDSKPVRRQQALPPSQKSKQKKKLARKKSSLPANFSSNKVDSENIYEEIEDVKAQSASSSVNNSDSGIGGVTPGFDPRTGATSLNSYGSSSASKSSSGGSTGNGNGSASKGTLDVSRPRHKKSSNSEQGKSAVAAAADRAKRKQESGIPLSSLDALISQTSPGLTAHQRLSLRKSLVDELFEELIQRHHRRVLDELRLDVEEFIAPSPDSIDLPTENSSNNVTPKSSRSSAQSCSKLHRCESMDFKDNNNLKKNSAQVENNSSNSSGRNAAASESNKKIGSKLWQSARKCTEVIQRKLKKSSLDQQQQQNSQPNMQQHSQLGANSVSVNGGSISSPNIVNSKPSISGPNLPPPVPPHQHLVSTGALNLQSQVTRRGHRPLSAIVTTSNNNNHKKISNSVNKEPVIDTLEDDSDNEQDAADRRLLRSKIIKSFWEQHDQEGGDFSEPEISSDKR
jgi:hypothetical protein